MHVCMYYVTTRTCTSLSSILLQIKMTNQFLLLQIHFGYLCVNCKVSALHIFVCCYWVLLHWFGHNSECFSLGILGRIKSDACCFDFWCDQQTGNWSICFFSTGRNFTEISALSNLILWDRFKIINFHWLLAGLVVL